MSKTATPIRTAIIGFGRSAEISHAPALLAIEPFEWVCAADTSEERLDAIKSFGVEAYDDYRTMLEAERPDLVVVLSRNDQHKEMSCDCLRAGAHVLLTKPLALNRRETDEMLDVAKESNKMLLPWMPMRWSKTFDALSDVLARNLIGDLFKVSHTASIFTTRDDWQMQTRFGGGYLLNYGPHLVDTVLRLLDTRVSKVQGWLAKITPYGDAEDVFEANMLLENDIHCTCSFTFSAFSGPTRWVLQGSKGTIMVKDDQLTVRYKPEGEAHNDIQTQEFSLEVPSIREGIPETMYEGLARHFAGETMPQYESATASHLASVLDAIRLSHEAQQVVELDPTGRINDAGCPQSFDKVAVDV